MVFLETNSSTRSSECFSIDSDSVDEHIVSRSPLCDLSVDMIKQLPLDYMHLVCLGVMRHLLIYWVEGALLNRLPFRKVTQLSEKIEEMIPFILCEFVRKPRSLIHLKRWKAVEFCLFLVYVGPLVLKKILSKDIVNHFMLFMLLSIFWCVT